MWNLQTNQTQVVAKHDAPIRHLFSVKEMNNMLVTGSWDKTIRYWDLRQPNPVHTQTLPERVYAMDVTHPLLVVGLANRRIQVHLETACCLCTPRHIWSKVANVGLHIGCSNLVFVKQSWHDSLCVVVAPS
jgi:WD40 repeat protein